MRTRPLTWTWTWALATFGLTALFILLAASSRLEPDEMRYLQYARNLTHGFFTTAEERFLWSGPGYPLVLAPLVAAGFPVLLAKLLNALFIVGTLLYLHGVMRLYLPEGKARAFALAGLLYMALHGCAWIPDLMTEPLSGFLVTGFAYHYCHGRRGDRRRMHLGLAALHLGWLALTKIFFGYAVAAGLGLQLVLVLLRRRNALQGAAIYGGALVICLPWLIYTHSLTGKLFYWGNSGGASLYWASAPEPELLGDVILLDLHRRHPDLHPRQSEILASLEGMDEVGRDSALKAIALVNFASYPGKAFQNWRANLNRLALDFPFSRFPGSHSAQKTGNRSLIFGAIFFLAALAVVPAWLGRRATPREIQELLAFALIALLGMSLLSAYARFVYPLLPIAILWLAFVFGKLVVIRMAK